MTTDLSPAEPASPPFWSGWIEPLRNRLAVFDDKRIDWQASSPAFQAIVQFTHEWLTPGGRALLWAAILVSVAVPFSGLELAEILAGCLLWSLWLVAGVMALIWRPRAEIRVVWPARLCVGHVGQVLVSVRNTGRLPGWDWWVEAFRLPKGLSAQPDKPVALPTLHTQQTASVYLGVYAHQRGVYQMAGARVAGSFPFGLISPYQVSRDPQRLLVYPAFRPLDRLGLAMVRGYQPGGVPMARMVGEGDEAGDFIGSREFRDGDNIRNVDWRATARMGRPIVREYRQESLVRVAVLVDSHIPQSLTGRLLDQQRADLEHRISLAAAVADHLASHEHLIDVFAVGPTLYHLTAGRGLACRDQVLDILACVEECRASPFGLIEPELMATLARLSAVVALLGDWDADRRELMSRLRASGVAMRVVVVRDAPCTLDIEADAHWLAGPSGEAVWLRAADFAEGGPPSL